MDWINIDEQKPNTTPIKILYEDGTESVAGWDGRDILLWDEEPKPVTHWKPFNEQ